MHTLRKYFENISQYTVLISGSFHIDFFTDTVFYQVLNETFPALCFRVEAGNSEDTGDILPGHQCFFKDFFLHCTCFNKTMGFP